MLTRCFRMRSTIASYVLPRIVTRKRRITSPAGHSEEEGIDGDVHRRLVVDVEEDLLGEIGVALKRHALRKIRVARGVVRAEDAVEIVRDRREVHVIAEVRVERF